MTETITVIGSDNSLCINSDGSYGVLYIAHDQKITCATCRFGKTNCVHVQYLSEFCIKTESELPGALQVYVQLLSHTPATSLERYSDYACLSRAKIPFELPNEMSITLRMPIRERFNMVNDVAELVPCNVSVICNQCHQSSWGDPYVRGDAKIVTNNQLLPYVVCVLTKVFPASINNSSVILSFFKEMCYTRLCWCIKL